MIRPLVALLILAVFAAESSAFNAGGHVVISLIAFDQLDEVSRDNACTLLRQHPRFQEHFVAQMPEEFASNKKEQDRWMFAFASTWPDLVKGNKVSRADRAEFNRGVWHYVNFARRRSGERLACS